MTEVHAPPLKADATEVKGLPPEALDRFRSAVIIALLARSGGRAEIPIADIDKLAADYVWGYSVQIPAAPTGELQIDARLGGVFRIELRSRQ